MKGECFSKLRQAWRERSLHSRQLTQLTAYPRQCCRRLSYSAKPSILL